MRAAPWLALLPECIGSGMRPCSGGVASLNHRLIAATLTGSVAWALISSEAKRKVSATKDVYKDEALKRWAEDVAVPTGT